MESHWTAITSNPTLTFWFIVVPPVLYAVHGWGATWCAIWLLFHPYKPITMLGYQLPLTPGIFPKRRSKLAQAVASTITETLLTPADIKAQAETLVTEANIYKSIDMFVDSVLKEFRDTTKLHRLASDIAEISPTLLVHLVTSTLDSLEQGKDHKIADITEKIFDQVILTARINLDQANEIAARIIEAFLTPEKVRTYLINLLSPQNINALDDSINAHAGGPYRILARIIGVKRVCYEWRNFLEKEPDEAHKIIGDLMKRFGIRDQIAVQIANFDLRSMPLQSIAKFKQNLVSFVESFLISHKDELISACRKLEGEARATVRSAVIRFNVESIPSEWLVRAKRDLTAFAHSYLKRELGEMLEVAIPALGMYSLIAHKIDLFSSEQLEVLVKRVCKQELKALEWFGAGIGAAIGLLQILVNLFAPYPKG